jgi:hypothetical protein
VLSEQHRPILVRCHFVAPVQPRFTNFLASEIRATKMGELEAPAQRSGFLSVAAFPAYAQLFQPMPY